MYVRCVSVCVYVPTCTHEHICMHNVWFIRIKHLHFKVEHVEEANGHQKSTVFSSIVREL